METYEDYGKGVSLYVITTVKSNASDEKLFHMHPHYELMIIPDAVTTRTVVNGKTIQTEFPLAMITAPYCMHFSLFLDGVREGMRHYVFYFDEEYIERFGENTIPVNELLDGKTAMLIDLRGHESTFGSVLRAMGDYRTLTEGHKLRYTGEELLLGSMLNMVKDLCAESRQVLSTAKQNYISDVIMYIVGNLEEDLRVPTLAERFFVSRDKLCRDFQKVMQMSIGDFIIYVRLNTAKLLLRQKKLTVKEIAYRVGFENDIYFYSFFKKHLGLTPREYVRRKDSKNDNLHKNTPSEL